MSAANADHFQLLLDYNRWANGVILDRAQQASESDYLTAVEGLSFGSLHATLVHILTSEMVWLSRWRGETLPEAFMNARQSDRISQTEIPTIEAMETLWRETGEALAKFAGEMTDDSVSSELEYADLSGNQQSQPLRELITHVLTHGMQFRAEAAVRLTQLGLSPGDLDFVFFVRQQRA